MKKILFIILTVLLITACAFSLASCDGLDALLGENNPSGALTKITNPIPPENKPQ